MAGDAELTRCVVRFTQAQANVVGIALYASVQLLGVPAGGFVVGWGSATSITAVFVMMTFIGYVVWCMLNPPALLLILDTQ